jgi:UDP-N-acetylmuramate: L-alanyl-gamma-D-glutamyl-meso-diaminopimelate ligase
MADTKNSTLELFSMHIHILGICGTFMGGLAQLAAASGHTVTGCDANVYPPMSDQLEQAGIRLVQGYDASQLSIKPDLWVIGNAISRGNPLLEAILNAGEPYTSGPQWIGEHVLRGRHVLAVAGTHGKTTTTSLLAQILDFCGKKPGFLVGGVPQDFGVSARLGEGRPFVIEADEYDTAFFDKRSKFVHYRPLTAILNNLEYDHADIFEDLAAIEKQFHHLVRAMPGRGLVIANGRCGALDRVLERGIWSRLERFDSPEGWTIDPDGRVAFMGEVFGTLRMSLMGHHNALNALAAIAAARDAGVRPQEALEALEHFVGVKRRLEVKGEARGVTVIDDFAHHPTAIAETIAALRGRIGGRRILAVLEPRSNTMKLGTMKERLAGALADAELVFCYAGKGVSWDTAEALAPLGDKARNYRGDLDRLVADVAAAAQPGDVVLCMSNGAFGGVHGKLLAALKGEQG